jgi:hypothetical protein
MINLMGYLIIPALLMEPKEMRSPSGRENRSVRVKSLMVPQKPSSRDKVTVKNIW